MDTQITNPIQQIVPHRELASTYGFASTADIISEFATHGWLPSDQAVAKVRVTDRLGFQRHLVRFRNPQFPVIPGLAESNASVPELCVLNSHDGTTRLRILFGAFRIACLNGLIAGTSLREVSVVHSGNIIQRLDDGIEHMVTGIPEMIQQVQDLQNAQFNAASRQEFVTKLVDARLSHVKPLSVDYDSALKAARAQDFNDDAFTVFNRVQEKLVRGGIHYTYEKKVLDEEGNVLSSKVANGTTRKLTSIPQSVKLNRMAYDLAIQLAA